MKKLNDILFSMLSSVILLIIFAVSIGYATFIESNESTEIAHKLVYNALWFEFLLILLIINLIGSVLRYDVFNTKKFSILLFHLAFIIILIGAGITRYFGYEGIMHIREGETSNEISSQISSVNIELELNGKKVEKNIEAKFGINESNKFSESIQIGDKNITIESELFIPNSIETIEADEHGEPGLNIFVMNENNQGEEIILMEGENNTYNGLKFAFADSSSQADINFSSQGEDLFMISKTDIAKISMMQNSEELIPSGTSVPSQSKIIYKTANTVFVVKKFMTQSKKSITQFMPDMSRSTVMVQPKNAIIFNVRDGNLSKKLNVFISDNQTPYTTNLNDLKISVLYGNLPHKLPFSITLNDFQLDRYPGSNSPSSYASEITLTDNENKTVTPFRIYMNNILNYRGYRFFQSSYDNDEKGTILSVNKDYWGTMITYIGYFLMLLGMILTLFNKNSRFFTVIKLSKEMQNKRKSTKLLTIIAFLTFPLTTYAIENKAIDKESHFKALSSLLIQDGAQGRVEPISTYASDVVRKISKKTAFKDFSSLEVLIGMCSNPEYWQNEALIKVAHEELANELGAEKGFISYSQMFDIKNGGNYKLADKVDAIYQKDPSMRNQYEKEIVNVDERLNIVNNIFMGNILTIFPVTGHDTEKWLAASEFSNHTNNDMQHGHKHVNGVCPVTGEMGTTDKSSSEQSMSEAMMDIQSNINNDTENVDMPSMANNMMNGLTNALSEPKPITPESLLNNYLMAVLQAEETGNWDYANITLQNIKNYQQLNGGRQLPDKNRVKLEIIYNNLSIFLTLAILYGLIGIILISMHIVNILKFNPKIDKYLDISIYPIFIMFLVYTIGLALRWYISDHAPWSNGYEAMIFVGWGTTLAGLIFAGKNPITLAITSLLAAIALSVAGMSWMNPEITNLVPVLKSYWLVVHVAVITSSYGFLATGAMLAFFNLCLMLARTSKNAVRLNDNIQEFSYIIELSLIIGLFMLTVGTFLGGVWANESWGRYWGWDSKETWALVSILVYSVILHLSKIPKTNNLIVFNSASLIGFSSVIMTFVGVNYYLSGMHSYGSGTPPPIPMALYLIIIGIVLLIYFANKNENKLKKS